MGCNQSKSASALVPQQRITWRHCGTQTTLSFKDCTNHLLVTDKRFGSQLLTDTPHHIRNKIEIHTKHSCTSVKSQKDGTSNANRILVQGILTNFSFSTIKITSDYSNPICSTQLDSADAYNNSLTMATSRGSERATLAHRFETLDYDALRSKSVWLLEDFETNQPIRAYESNAIGANEPIRMSNIEAAETSHPIRVFDFHVFDVSDKVEVNQSENVKHLCENESNYNESHSEEKSDEFAYETKKYPHSNKSDVKMRFSVAGTFIENGVVVYHIQIRDSEHTTRWKQPLKKRYNDFKALYQSMKNFHLFRLCVPPLPSSGVITYFYRNNAQTIRKREKSFEAILCALVSHSALYSHPNVQKFLFRQTN